MTIKRSWTDERGINREKVLKAGYKEKLSVWNTDVEGKVYDMYEGILHVVSDEEMEFNWRLPRSWTIEQGEKKGSWVFAGEDIKYFIQSKYYNERAISHRGILSRNNDKDVSFLWEPTLPTSARK